MAPEIIQEKEYSGVKADIFALGIILFQLCFNANPWTEASVPEESRTYRRFAVNGKIQDMMRFHASQKHRKMKEIEIDNSLYDLLNKLLSPEPINRFDSVSEIMNHPWLS